MAETRAFGADMRALIERDGPFLSVYLNTEAAHERGPEEIGLRWRALADQAAAAGASAETLAAVESIVSDAHLKGDGLVAFAAGDALALRRFLPTAIPDCVRFGPLPHLSPYVEWQQDNPRYAVVLSDRIGAEINLVGGFDVDENVSVDGIEEPLTKVSPGGWSQRRYQQRAENTWEANAKEVARELANIVSEEEISFVVLAGDVRSRTFVKENLGVDLPLVEVDSEPVVSIDEIRDDLESAVAAYVGGSTKQVLEKFHEERGQDDLAAEGVDATLKALRIGQVDTLLLTRDVDDRIAWFTTQDLTQAALDKGPLTDLGLGDVAEAPAEEVLVRTALGTGARVAILPTLDGDHGPAEGVGALLRFRPVPGG
ncbi:MAG TPA: Vms1/Ankzf1 family peptidyl-tRNA hydrolase [Actinomycetota bacterium]|jgi:peptide subunit release factor 1 (eRF1)